MSIIIPVYNQLDLTLACLGSIARQSGCLTFEVIVIDDCSASDVATTLSRVPNLRLISNETNQGFVLNCNRGAAEANGNFLVFLNNDTEVGAGWLEALHQVFSERPKAGLVGAKLVYPDGSLQEAGGIIWEDGTGHNFGKGDDPSRPEYNYLRQADYCTGACIMVPRSLFEEAGGFDPIYCPAYYEDADLAFTIRASGREIYFQPAAMVKHFEGASSGTDTRLGPKRSQITNQKRFAEKWAETLAGFGNDHTLTNLARDRHATGRVLVIDACALTPDMDAGSVRMFNLLKILGREGCKVTFVPENLQFHEPYSSFLQQEGVEHLGVPAIYDLTAYLESNAFAFDIIILSRKHVARNLMKLLRRCAPRAKIVFDTVDLMFLRFFRQADVEKSEKIREEAEASKQVELELCREADLVYVVSPEEAKILSAEISPEKIAVVPLIHDVASCGPGYDERDGIMFVGGFQHPPNLDAIEFFLDEILPLLAQRLPSLPVHLVGSNMPERLQRRASSQIVVHGYVPSMNDLLNQVRLSIAPLRYGAGVKGKVNQSMAHGVPVVATSMATEGMHLIDGVNVMTGDTPVDFANALYRLYTDKNLWTRISAAGLENIREHFSFSAVREKLVHSLIGQVPHLLTPRRVLPAREIAMYRLNEILPFGRSNRVEPFLDGGWSAQGEEFRWAVDRKSRLSFRFDHGQQPSKMRLIMFPLLVPGRVGRQRVLINLPTGANPTVLEMTKGEPHEFIVEFPRTEPSSGIFVVEFAFPDAVVPRELGLSEDLRRLSVAFVQLIFS
ncbi:MAG: glycosyltransferase [Lacunisphaera sp.]